MIRDVVLPALLAHFPNRGFRLDDSPNAIGIFPAAHDSVGDVTIHDDGDKATIFVGAITIYILTGTVLRIATLTKA